MSDVIDLDALVPPENVVIKFGTQEITLKPPTTAEILKLGFLGQKLGDAKDMADEDIDKLVIELTALIQKCVPELADQVLNTAQLLKLIVIISQMAMPPDVKELESRKITVDSPKV